MNKHRSEEKDHLNEFIKLAQYISNITLSQNVWDELGKLIPGTFGADFVSFVKPELNVKPEPDNSLDYTSMSDKSVWRKIRTEILDSIIQVSETGFLATEAIATPEPYALLLVPIQEGRTQVIVMAIGYPTQTVLSKELLNLYLGIAGLVGNIISRIRSEEELQTGRSRLEKLVQERTYKLKAANRELSEANRKLTNMLQLQAINYELLAANAGLEDINARLEKEITERQEAEKEIIRLNAELEKRVAERTYQLQEINASLEEEIAVRTKVEGDLKASELQLRQSESRLIAAQLMAHVGNWELDLDTGDIWASEEAFNIYGIEHISQYLPLDFVQGCVLPEYRESLNKALAGLISKKEKYDQEYKLKNYKTREERFIHSKAILLVDENGKASKVVGTIQDITDRKGKESEVLFLSYHDQLTGLYNRRFYEEELKRLDTERNLPLTVVMADVNGLKLINDSFGHAMGDELLKKVAEVLVKGCRSDDIIARLGGDEFVILLPKTNAQETEQIIKRIKGLASNENVEAIDISISFGYAAKNNKEEIIQEISKKAEDHMYKKKLFESPSMRSKTIQAIISTLYEKNKREDRHSHRVSALCESMGKALNLSEGGIEELKTVGLLHDIGKIAIEESILNKPGKLTDDEWEEIKRHPEIGYRILSTVNDMAEMAEYVLSHHEKWDGGGYPKGLKREEIPFQSRIIAIADTYDAMTSERSYRSALPETVAIEELQKNAGLQFDPELVRVFIEKVLNKPLNKPLNIL